MPPKAAAARDPPAPGTDVALDAKALEADPAPPADLPLVELVKGFARPFRRCYVHIACGKPTCVGLISAKSVACQPRVYTDLWCATEGARFPISEFVWLELDLKVSAAKVGD